MNTMNDEKSAMTARLTKNETTPEKKRKARAKSEPVRGIVCNCNRLNVRSAPNTTSANILCTVSRGDGLTIVSNRSTDDFYYVRLKNGKTGYVLKKYVKVPS